MKPAANPLFTLLMLALGACSGADAGPQPQAGEHAPEERGVILPPEPAVTPDAADTLPEPDMLPPRIRCARVPCGDTPLVSAASVARELYEQAATFYVDPVLAGDRLTPELRSLIERDQACAAEQGMCAIGADPWSAAQDGERGDPVTYRTFDVERRIKDSPTAAKVEVCFSFVLDPQAPEQRCAVLVMERALRTPWRVADLIDPDGQSLRELLRGTP